MNAIDANTEVTLKLSVVAVNVVLTALSKLPYEAVSDIIQNVQQQATEQLTPQAAGGTD